MLPDAPPPRSRIRWRWIAVAAILAILVGLAGAALAVERGWLGEADVEVEPAPPGAPALTADERAYYDYVIPRLRELAAQARALATLGEEKSRNLFEIQARGQRLDELIDEIAVYGREHGVPERFAPVATGFAEGARLTRQAMADSRQGMARFDWDQVEQAVPVFLSGADRLEATAAELERLGGAATPVTGTAGTAGRRDGGDRETESISIPAVPALPAVPAVPGIVASRSWPARRRVALAVHLRRWRRRASRVPDRGGGADAARVRARVGGGGRGGRLACATT